MRPIMGAKVGPNTGLSQIGCQLIRAINNDVQTRFDVKSTEEMLSKITNYNNSLKTLNSKKLKRKVIASMDIKSFYPSIDPKKGAKIAREMWEKSSVEIDDLNVDQLAFYIGKFGPKSLIDSENIGEYVYTKTKKKYEKKVAKKVQKLGKPKKLSKEAKKTS